jgi:hypothetical protein
MDKFQRKPNAERYRQKLINTDVDDQLEAGAT